MRNKGGPQIVRLGPIELKNVKLPIGIYKIIPSWQGVGVSEALVGRNRVAVLPFPKISPDQADEYFADALTEDHLDEVEGQRAEHDLYRTSLMQYKNQAMSIPEIGREVNAGTILEGSVRKAGNRLRLSIQMIDAVEDKHVWAENYAIEIRDIFAVQSVKLVLEPALTATEKQTLNQDLPTWFVVLFDIKITG